MNRRTISLLLSTLIFPFSGCDDGDTRTRAAVIGSEGGSITTPSGAAIIIPPGALDSETTIELTYYGTPSDLPTSAGIMGEYLGGVVLSPEGLEFSVPAMITIPLSEPLTAGEEVKLFYFDRGKNENYPENYAGWQQTEFIGTTGSDGRGVVAKIDHFSTFVIQMNLGGHTLDVLGDSVTKLGDNGLGVDFAAYQDYFETNVAKIGDLHAYNLPSPFNSDCYEVVGLEYILYHNLGDLFTNPLYDFKEKTGEVAFFYNYEGDRMIAGKIEQQLVYHLFITVHMDRTPPAIKLSAAKNQAQFGEQVTATGNLSCGADSVKNREMSFGVDGLGSIAPVMAQTDPGGNAKTTFTAGNKEGTAVLTGKYSAHRKDKIEIISDTTTISIGDASEIWSGTISYTVDAEEGVGVQAHYDVAYQFSLNRYTLNGVKGGILTGDATATQNVSLSAEPCTTSKILNAPSKLNFQVTGKLYDDTDTFYLHLYTGMDMNVSDFHYEYEVCDTCDFPGCDTHKGINFLSLGDLGANPVPLSGGTHSGSFNASGDHVYTIKLARDK